MGPSKNIEISQESRLKYILRKTMNETSNSFRSLYPFTLYTVSLQTGGRVHVAGQHGSGPQDVQNFPPEGITEASPSPQIQDDGGSGK